MAKIKKIPIYLLDITDEFTIFQHRRVRSFCGKSKFVLDLKRFTRMGKFLTADMPDGESVFSSLN